MVALIWILKGLMAALFTYVGVSKILLPKAKLLENGMKGLLNLEEKQIKVAGMLELMGALGLMLPSLLNMYAVLSGFAAMGLCLTMVVAGLINYKLKLSVIPNIVIFLICVLIAYWELKEANLW